MDFLDIRNHSLLAQSLRKPGTKIPYAVCWLLQAAKNRSDPQAISTHKLGAARNIPGRQPRKPPPVVLTPGENPSDPVRDLARWTRYFSTINSPSTSASIPELKKVRMASVGVQTMGSPRKLNEVFITTGTPVRLANSRIKRQ
jgi:hypothetical protein